MSEVKSWDDNGVQFAWDATSIKMAEKCLRYYGYIIEGWEPLRKSVHLIWGGHFATALERFAKKQALGATREEALIQVVHEALIDTWEYDRDEEGKIIPGTGQPWQSDHNAKTRENLIRSIIWYADHYADDNMKTVHLQNGKPAVELSFTLDADGLILCGHLDKLVEYGGDLYVMDQKSTGSTITPRWFDQFSPDSQMSLYAFAGKAVFDTPVKGVVIDGAQVAVGFTRFERGFAPRTTTQLEEWLSDAKYTIEEAQEATLKKRFPHRTTSCDQYGGCMFRDVCARSPEVRKHFLEADFKKGKRWNPLERR